MPRVTSSFVPLVLFLLLGCASAKSSVAPSSRPASEASPTLAGEWVGTLMTPGGNLHLQLAFPAEDRGTMVSLDQGPRQLPVTLVERKGSHVVLDVDVPGAPARVSANLSGDVMDGTFSQRDQVMPVTFKRTANAAASAGAKPARALPHDTDAYSEQLVTVHNGPITLAGTLTLPRGVAHPPVVVLITGSGPQDRNETVFGLPIFGVLADVLARHGIAVLRQDDRGVAESTGDFHLATTEDFATDTEAAVRYLQTRTDLGLGELGLIGHSEGAMIAPLVATRMPQVKFVVLLAPPAEPGDELLVEQAAAIQRAEKVPAAEIDRGARFERKVYAALKAGQSLSTLEDELPAGLSKEAFEKQSSTLTSPWFLAFLRSDPEAVLRKLTVPTLAVFGALDTQVPAVTNAPRLRAALQQSHNAHVEVLVLPGLNHLYQRAQTGSFSEYARLDKRVDSSMLDAVTSWLARR